MKKKLANANSNKPDDKFYFNRSKKAVGSSKAGVALDTKLDAQSSKKVIAKKSIKKQIKKASKKPTGKVMLEKAMGKMWK